MVGVRAVIVLILAGFCISTISCGGVRARRGAPEESGFLRDYSMLKPDSEIPVRLGWKNPDVVWSNFDSVWVSSVTLWANEEKQQGQWTRIGRC